MRATAAPARNPHMPRSPAPRIIIILAYFKMCIRDRYINSFAIAAGELKHGTIALMEPGTLVIALACQDFLYEKMVSNIQEIKARGAYVMAMAKEGNTSIADHSDKMIYIPWCRDEIRLC